MNLRRHLIESATLVVLSVACALGANLLAGRERKLSLPGSYPNALSVPARTPAAPASSSGSVSPVTQPPGSSLAGIPQTPVPAAAPSVRPTPSPVAAERPPRGQAQEARAPSAVPAAGAAEGLLARFPPHGTPYVEITGADAAWLHEHAALILDARRTKVYEAGHLAGARSFPVWESDLDERVLALVGEGRNTDLPVVLYCSGGDCEDSHMLAERLFGVGFNNLRVYRDGYPDWLARGGAVSVGSKP